MAQYYGLDWIDPFTPRDIKEVRSLLDSLGFFYAESVDPQGRVCIEVASGNRSFFYESETEDGSWEELFLPAELATNHLAEGEELYYFSVGYERLLGGGYSCAYDSKGNILRHISLNDIVRKEGQHG